MSEDEDPSATAGFRSYEVYQRERVGETTNLVDPRALLADSYLDDPFTLPGVMRDNYPCYRDWVGNRFWITRYDDVTSVFVDDANFESRTRASAYAPALVGRDFSSEDAVERTRVEIIDEIIDLVLARLADSLEGTVDLAVDFADRLAADLVGGLYGFDTDAAHVLQLVRQVQAGAGWSERDRVTGLDAANELRRIIGAELDDRTQAPAGDLLTVMADHGAGVDDVIVTLLEADIETVPGSLANLWALLLSHPEQFDKVRTDPRLMKFAYLEALRHSPVELTANRFARTEVERFGRLIPQGAMLHLSAAAANRDPRQFANPNDFVVGRKDLCQREPRGQYRADGLPAAITFGHGKPSSRPAVPRDAPRSSYALTRDIVVAASLAILDRFPNIAISNGDEPAIGCRRLGGPYRAWHLPVQL